MPNLWLHKYSPEAQSSPIGTDYQQAKDTQMITFHPAARKTAAGFIPMVTLRKDKGRMVGSKLAQNGTAFATALEALEHAARAALRVAAQYPDLMRVAS
jgi:hypothetical protein